MSTTLSAIRPWTSWNSIIGLAELLAAGRPVGSRAESALGGAGRPRGDHEALLDEPVARKLVALADLAEHRVLADDDVLEAELGVLVHERVHVARRAEHGDAGSVLVDEEEGGRALGQDHGQHDQVVGDVADGDEPLLAVQAVPAVDALGRGLYGARIGAGVGLGHRHAVAPLAPNPRQQVALALGVVAGPQRVGRPPDHVPERVRQLAELLLHDDLVEHAQALSAPLGRHVDRVQAMVAHSLGHLALDLVRQAARRLARLLVDHDLLGQGPRAGLELELLGGVREIHLPSFVF